MKQPEKLTPEAGGFDIESDFKQPIEQEISEEEGVSEEPSQALVQVNEALIETSAKMIGKVMELITKIPEMNFDEEEVQQLKLLWSPIIPVMSPVLGAIIGTSIIFSGKVAIYKTMKDKVPEKVISETRKKKKEKKREQDELQKQGDTVSE